MVKFDTHLASIGEEVIFGWDGHVFIGRLDKGRGMTIEYESSFVRGDVERTIYGWTADGVVHFVDATCCDKGRTVEVGGDSVEELVREGRHLVQSKRERIACER